MRPAQLLVSFIAQELQFLCDAAQVEEGAIFIQKAARNRGRVAQFRRRGLVRQARGRIEPRQEIWRLRSGVPVHREGAVRFCLQPVEGGLRAGLLGPPGSARRQRYQRAQQGQG
jgi:hypothetical protein